MKKVSYGFLVLGVLVLSGWLLSNVVLAIVYPSETDNDEVNSTEELEESAGLNEENTLEEEEEEIILRSSWRQSERFTRSELLDWRESPPHAYGGIQVFFDEVEYDLGFGEEVTDDEIIRAIHYMSHQKIRAEHKHGHIPLTRDTVDQLYDAIYSKEDSKHEDLFKDIIDRWNEEDWSAIDHEHNIVWKYDREENIGAAYNKASALEEMNDIMEHFPDMFEALKE